MKTALHFLSEWARGEGWKVYLINESFEKKTSDPQKLMQKVVQIIETGEKVQEKFFTQMDSVSEEILTIKNLKSPTNINALSEKIEFSLGQRLNVFYGENGSGKSSYIRMFRKLADNYYTSEKNLNIIPNVYGDQLTNEAVSQLVNISFKLDGQLKDELVDINKRHEQLCKINVLDSDSITPLINDDLTFNILPKGFENFQNVSKLIDLLRNETSDILRQLKEKKEEIFIDTSHANIRDELNQILKDVISIDELNEYLNNNYPIPMNYKEIIEETDLRIKELESGNPEDKIKILKAQKLKVESIKDSIQKLSLLLNQNNLNKINNLIKEYEEKLAEEQRFNQSFKNRVFFLDIINTEWLEFIKAGKHYLDSIDKTQLNYNDPCIFCSAPLIESRIELIGSYIKQVNDSNSDKLRLIETEIQKNIIENEIKLFSKEEEALFGSEKFIEKIKSTIQLLNLNVNIFNDNIVARVPVENTQILDLTHILKTIELEIIVLGDRIKKLNDSREENFKAIETLKYLKMNTQKNVQIHNLSTYFDKWFQLTKEMNKLESIKLKFSTNTLTIKQKEAFKAIVEKKYFEIFDKFSEQLKVTNVNFKLIPKKGETLRKKYITSEHYKVTQIMSEGEQKAIAMAEFATDLTMRNDFNPILLDDPVTSLDYKRTELIANLVHELSKERQVLVFTHNIMFYYMLYNMSTKPLDKENKFFKIDEIDKMNKGYVSESFSGRMENLKIITKRLREQNDYINSDSCFGDELEESLKKAYSDIRTWCELIVEEGFLKNIIRRHEPNIMFTKVKDINHNFVNELEPVNKLFSKSCRWMSGHSQSIESQNNRATKEAFNEDIQYILRLSDEYKS